MSTDLDQLTIESLGWNIVVLDRGWVYVGKVHTEGDWLIIESAKNIRIWGTTGKGLGALKNGPLADTKLDEYGVVRAYRTEVKHLISVEESKWNA